MAAAHTGGGCRITLYTGENAEQSINTAPGENLLAALHSAGIYIPAPCGGRGSCGKCAVQVRAGALPVTAADRRCFSPEELNTGRRLACAAVVTGDIAIPISGSGEERFQSLDTFTLDSGGSGTGTEPPAYSAAVDIGTTTLGFALLDTSNNRIAGRLAMVNKQREHGGDVISRIQYANNGGLPALTHCVRAQIAAGLDDLCRSAGITCAAIQRIAIAGNTTMLHFLQGFDCRGLGTAPFTPVTLELTVKHYAELFDGGCSAEVIILPGISTWVGADITAGIFYTGLYRSGQPAALIDIGTNGEMALAYNGTMLCTAAAAGPAFEGGNIRWGTGSVPAAISAARFQNGTFELEVIGGGQPEGICGSGVVDIVFQGLHHGLIDSSGRFSSKTAPGGIVLAQNSRGQEIIFCQKDVRELQLAKSAIRTGFDALLNRADLDYHSLKTLYIAGGFGFSLNMKSAVGIGLVPEALLPVVRRAGNSSLGGAAQLLLNPGSETTVMEIARTAREFTLPTNRYFSERFIENTAFPLPVH